MSACLFVYLYVYMSVRVFVMYVMYVMYVLWEFLGKDQDNYETSLVNVKSEKLEWMTMNEWQLFLSSDVCVSFLLNS